MGIMKEGNMDVMRGNTLYDVVLGPSQLLLQ